MLAAIDVGSNTVRLLLGHTTCDGVEPFLYERYITRLKGGASAAGLAPEAMDRTLAALHAFARIMAREKPVACRAVGTAALRHAVNADDFIRRAALETGIRIELISGEEEARLAALGVTAALSPLPPACLVVDIGGGSTEFVLLVQRKVIYRASIPLGVVTLAEHNPSVTSRRLAIATQLGPVFAALTTCWSLPLGQLPLVGTAGTVTTLAAMQMQMTTYDWRRINNCRLPVGDLQSMSARLDALSPAARESLPGMEKGRGDLILPGAEILLAICARMSATTVLVSDFGLLEGVLCDLDRTATANN